MNNDIQKTLMAGERVTLECQKAQRRVPNSLWGTYSAKTRLSDDTAKREIAYLKHISSKKNGYWVIVK